MNNDVEVKIGGSTTEVESAVLRTTSIVQDAMAKIKESFAQAKSSIAGGFDNVKTDGLKQAKTAMTDLQQGAGGVSKAMGIVKGSMAAFAAIMAGGAVFKAGIEESQKLTGEANKLAKALGIDTSSASALNVALGDIYSSTDEFVDASAKLSRQMRNDEQALNKMGLTTRDASGEYRNMQDIMLDSVKVLNTYKEGTDRNLAAQTMFGKGAGEITALLKLNTETIDAAKEKQAALGLVVGKENVEALKQYKAAMNDAGDVMSAVKKAIGDAVMPVLTRLGEWFSSVGPAAVTVIKGAIGGLVATFWALKNGITVVWELLNAFVVSVAEPIRAVGEAIYKALTGDFEGAKEAIKDIPNKVSQAWTQAFNEIVQGSEDTQQKIANLFNAPTATDVKKPQGKSYTDPKDKGKEESRVAGWETELAKEKEAYAQKQAMAGTFHEYSLQDEINYWAKIRNQQDLTEKEKNSVDKKYYEGLSNLRKKNFEAHLAALKTELESYQNNQTERLAVASKMAEEIGQKYGTESKEYQAAQQQIIQIERQKEQQLLQIADAMAAARQSQRQAAVDDAEALAQIDVTLGKKTNAELIADQRQFEAQRYEIALEGLNRRQALLDAQGADKDIVEYQKLLTERATLDQQYAVKKRSLDQKSAQDSMKYWNGFQSSLASTYASGLNQILARTLKFKDALKGLFREIGKAFVQELVVKQVSEWAAMQTKNLAMTAATKAKELAISLGFMSSETAAKTTATTTQTGIVATGATTEIGAKGASAGAGAASAMAGIPIVGPVLAIGAMAAVLAAVLALRGKIKSASGGYSIPRGTNPITQLHEEEMVLPKAESSVIKDLAAGKIGGGGSSGGSGSGGNGSGTVNYHDYSGKLSREQIRQNAKIIAEEVSRITKRGFVPA